MTDLAFVAALFVPGHRPERFVKAAAAGADAIIIDLEDAVPADAKDAARNALRVDFTHRFVLVRINAAGTAWHAGDVAAATGIGAAAIMLPKAEFGEALNAVCAAASASGCSVVALIETAGGVVQARDIAATAGVARLAFGSIDYCADLGCAHTRHALLSARTELVVASRIAGLVAPVDGVTVAIDNAAAVTDDARYARELGFGGKLCIHPRQVEPVLDGFAPPAEEIAWARRVLSSGDGAVAVDGAMVDEPVRIRARSILARAGNNLADV